MRVRKLQLTCFKVIYREKCLHSVLFNVLKIACRLVRCYYLLRGGSSDEELFPSHPKLGTYDDLFCNDIARAEAWSLQFQFVFPPQCSIMSMSRMWTLFCHVKPSNMASRTSSTTQVVRVGHIVRVPLRCRFGNTHPRNIDLQSSSKSPSISSHPSSPHSGSCMGSPSPLSSTNSGFCDGIS